MEKKTGLHSIIIPSEQISLSENQSKGIIVQGKNAPIEAKVAIFDALDTTVIYNPQESIKDKEMRLLYVLENPGKFTPENVAILNQAIKDLGMEDFANSVRLKLINQGKTEKQMFYILADIVATEYCLSKGDKDEELRMDVCRRIYALADPELFPKVIRYIEKEYGKNVGLLLLTQANPIMKKIYQEMVGQFGVSVMVAPDASLNNLYKDDPKLYNLIAEIISKEMHNIGLLDDSKKNISAAEKAGAIVEHYDGEDLTSSAKRMIDKLYGNFENKNEKQPD